MCDIKIKRFPIKLNCIVNIEILLGSSLTNSIIKFGYIFFYELA